MSFREHHFSAQYTPNDSRNQDICKLATAQIIRYVRNLLWRQGGGHCLALAEEEFLQIIYIAAWKALEQNPKLPEEPPREIALVLKRRLTTLVDRHGPDKLGLGQRNRPERFFRTMRSIDETLPLAANADEASYGHLVYKIARTRMEEGLSRLILRASNRYVANALLNSSSGRYLNVFRQSQALRALLQEAALEIGCQTTALRLFYEALARVQNDLQQLNSELAPQRRHHV